LKKMTRRFPVHVASRQPSELVINKGNQFVQSRLIPVTPGDEQLSDFMG
jgi:hypothetical protein